MKGCLMVLGTGSSVGQSFLVAGLCRLLRQDGHRVAPFKAQNMSFAVPLADGTVVASSTIIQAEAAGIELSPAMNPILLQATGEQSARIYINGRLQGAMSARKYLQQKPKLKAQVKQSYLQLAASYDIIVIEGAGSPAEINLRENDLVNMGLAELVDAPVVLVGDIDRGGVFAALAGTMLLLQPQEKERVKGVIINKFRGDITLLESGIHTLESIIKVPVLGVIPYLDLDLGQEDSLDRQEKGSGPILAPHRRRQYDLLADKLRQHLDLTAIYRFIEEGNRK